MKSRVAMIIGIVVFLVVGFLVYSMPKEEAPTPSVKEEQEIKNVVGEDVKEDNSPYTSYSRSVLEGSSNLRRVLFFYASWCPTCKRAQESLSANLDKIPSDVVVIRVNYNDPDTDQEEKELSKKYGITYQHTFVQIDSLGEVVTKWNGGEIEELLSRLK